MRCFLALTLAFFLAACSSIPPVPPADAAIQQCLVCRCRRDFDCLTVRKSATAPRAQYGGREHYFCSESCREEFQHNPSAYWPPR